MNAPETTPPSPRWLSGFLAFGSALVLLLTLLLGVASVVSTVGGATIWGPTTPCPTSAAVIGLSLVVLAICLALCRLLVRRSDLINLPLLEASLAGIALLVGLWFIWVNHTETSLFHDSLVLQQFAEHLSAGDLSDFWPHIDNYAAKAPGDLYMSIYPHQAGLLLLMTGLRCLFGSGMVKALQVMNLLAVIGVSALLCSLARAVERPRGERAVLALVAYGFLPNVLLSVFPYGNTIGLLLVLAASRVLLASLRNASGARSAALGLASGLLALSGLMIKSTYIYLVAGVVLIALLGCIKEKARVRAVVLLFSTGVLLALSSSVPRAGFKALVGYALPEDQPKMTWLAIGLDYQPSADPRPGWYNPIGMDNRIRHNGNVGDEEATAESVVLDRLGHLAGNPGYGAWFFAKKLAYEWLDPTYDSYFVASFSKMSEEDAARWGRGADARFYPMDLTKPHGYVCLVLFIVMDACQSLLYLGAALGARDLMREALHGGRGAALAEYALPCVFFAGFLLYLVWEGKSMYTLPLAISLLPTAARGIATFVRRPLHRHFAQ